MSAPTPDELAAKLREVQRLQRAAAQLAGGKPAKRGGKPPGISAAAWIARVNLAAEAKMQSLLTRLEKEQ